MLRDVSTSQRRPHPERSRSHAPPAPHLAGYERVGTGAVVNKLVRDKRVDVVRATDGLDAAVPVGSAGVARLVGLGVLRGEPERAFETAPADVDRAARLNDVLSKSRRVGISVEYDERVPGETLAGVHLGVAVPEPPADGQIGVIQMGDATVCEDVLAMSVAEPVAFDRLPDGEHA